MVLKAKTARTASHPPSLDPRPPRGSQDSRPFTFPQPHPRLLRWFKTSPLLAFPELASIRRARWGGDGTPRRFGFRSRLAEGACSAPRFLKDQFPSQAKDVSSPSPYYLWEIFTPGQSMALGESGTTPLPWVRPSLFFRISAETCLRVSSWYFYAFRPEHRLESQALDFQFPASCRPAGMDWGKGCPGRGGGAACELREGEPTAVIPLPVSLSPPGRDLFR